MTSLFWDVELSGLGSNDATEGSAGGVEKGYSTSNMKLQGTFDGFDFDTVWRIDGDYPTLKWEP